MVGCSVEAFGRQLLLSLFPRNINGSFVFLLFYLWLCQSAFLISPVSLPLCATIVFVFPLSLIIIKSKETKASFHFFLGHQGATLFLSGKCWRWEQSLSGYHYGAQTLAAQCKEPGELASGWSQSKVSPDSPVPGHPRGGPFSPVGQDFSL